MPSRFEQNRPSSSDDGRFAIYDVQVSQEERERQERIDEYGAIEQGDEPSWLDRLSTLLGGEKEQMDTEDSVTAQIELDARKRGLTAEEYKNEISRDVLGQDPLGREIQQGLDHASRGVLDALGPHFIKGTAKAGEWITAPDTDKDPYAKGGSAHGFFKDIGDKIDAEFERRGGVPDSIVYDAAGAIGSTATFWFPMIGVTNAARAVSLAPKIAAALGSTTAAVLEGGQIAGGVYDTVVKDTGGDHNKAQVQGLKAFGTTVPITAALNMALMPERVAGFGKLGKASRFGIGASGEATQEAAQSAAEDVFTDRPIDWGKAAYSGGLAILPGGGFGMVSAYTDPLSNKQKKALAQAERDARAARRDADIAAYEEDYKKRNNKGTVAGSVPGLADIIAQEDGSINHQRDTQAVHFDLKDEQAANQQALEELLADFAPTNTSTAEEEAKRRGKLAGLKADILDRHRRPNRSPEGFGVRSPELEQKIQAELEAITQQNIRRNSEALPPSLQSQAPQGSPLSGFGLNPKTATVLTDIAHRTGDILSRFSPEHGHRIVNERAEAEDFIRSKEQKESRDEELFTKGDTVPGGPGTPARRGSREHYLGRLRERLKNRGKAMSDLDLSQEDPWNPSREEQMILNMSHNEMRRDDVRLPHSKEVTKAEAESRRNLFKEAAEGKREGIRENARSQALEFIQKVNDAIEKSGHNPNVGGGPLYVSNLQTLKRDIIDANNNLMKAKGAKQYESARKKLNKLLKVDLLSSPYNAPTLGEFSNKTTTKADPTNPDVSLGEYHSEGDRFVGIQSDRQGNPSHWVALSSENTNAERAIGSTKEEALSRLEKQLEKEGNLRLDIQSRDVTEEELEAMDNDTLAKVLGWKAPAGEELTMPQHKKARIKAILKLQGTKESSKQTAPVQEEEDILPSEIEDTSDGVIEEEPEVMEEYDPNDEPKRKPMAAKKENETTNITWLAERLLSFRVAKETRDIEDVKKREKTSRDLMNDAELSDAEIEIYAFLQKHDATARDLLSRVKESDSAIKVWEIIDREIRTLTQDDLIKASSGLAALNSEEKGKPISTEKEGSKGAAEKSTKEENKAQKPKKKEVKPKEEKKGSQEGKNKPKEKAAKPTKDKEAKSPMKAAREKIETKKAEKAKKKSAPQPGELTPVYMGKEVGHHEFLFGGKPFSMIYDDGAWTVFPKGNSKDNHTFPEGWTRSDIMEAFEIGYTPWSNKNESTAPETKTREKGDRSAKGIKEDTPKFALDNDQKSFVKKKVEELGSFEAVENAYSKDDDLSVYAKKYAAKLYGKEYTAPSKTKTDELKEKYPEGKKTKPGTKENNIVSNELRGALEKTKEKASEASQRRKGKFASRKEVEEAAKKQDEKRKDELKKQAKSEEKEANKGKSKEKAKTKKTPPVAPKKTGKKAPSKAKPKVKRTLDESTIKKAIPAATKVEKRESGLWVAYLPHERFLIIEPHSTKVLAVSDEEIKMYADAHGLDPKDVSKPVGRFMNPTEIAKAHGVRIDTGAVIQLSTEGIARGKLPHEVFHAARKFALTKAQNKVLNKAYRNDEEAMARDYEDYLDGLFEEKQAKGIRAKMFSKIKSFWENIRAGLFDDPDPRGGPGKIFEQVASGKGFERAIENLDRNLTPRFSPRASLKKRMGDNADAQAFLDNTDYGDKTMAERLSEVTRADVWEAALFDRFAPIKLIEKQWEKEFGKKITAEESGYIAHRLGASVSGSILGRVLEDGYPSWDAEQGVVGISSPKEKMGPLGILEKLGEDADVFLHYMMAKRLQGLLKQEREALYSEKQVKGFLKEAENIKQENRETWEWAEKKWGEFFEGMADFMVDSGLISRDVANKFESRVYIPIYRSFENKNQIGYKSDSKHISAGTKRYSGKSTRKNTDPLQNVIANVSHVLTEAVRNNARIKSLVWAADLGIVHHKRKGWRKEYTTTSQIDEALRKIFKEHLGVKVPDTLPNDVKKIYGELYTIFQPVDPETISVRIDGKSVYYDIEDPMLLQSLMNTPPKFFTGFIGNVLQQPKHWLTFCATVTVPFRVKNLLRDSTSAWVLEGETIPLLDSMKAMIKIMKNDPQYLEMLGAGGGFSAGDIFAHSDLAKAAKIQRNRFKSYRYRWFDPRRAWNKWMEVGEAFENATRLALYSKIMGKTDENGDPMFTKARAAYESRDLMDFSRQGNNEFLQGFIRTVPFLNARIQGINKLGRSAAKNPKGVAARVAILAAFSQMLWFWNNGDDERREIYQEIEDWERWTNHLIVTPFGTIKIPKGFESDITVTSLIEAINQAVTSTEGGDHIVEYLKWWTKENMSFDLPQIVKPIYEIQADKSGFTGRPIEGYLKESRPSGMRYDPWTPEVLKEIGRKTGISPKKLKHMIQGYFASVGTGSLAVVDMAYRSLADTPERPTMDVAQYPIVGGLIRAFHRPHDKKQTRFQTKFYELADEINKINGEYSVLVEERAFNEIDVLLKDKRAKLAMNKFVSKFKTKLSELRKAEKSIWNDSTMNGDEKRRRTEELGKTKRDLFEIYYEAMAGRLADQ